MKRSISSVDLSNKTNGAVDMSIEETAKIKNTILSGINSIKALLYKTNCLDQCISRIFAFCRSVKTGFVADAELVGLKALFSRFKNLWSSGLAGKSAITTSIFLVFILITAQFTNDSKTDTLSNAEFIDDFEAQLPSHLRPIYRNNIKDAYAIKDDLGRDIAIEHIRYTMLNSLSPAPKLICRKCSREYHVPPAGIVTYGIFCERGGNHEPK